MIRLTENFHYHTETNDWASIVIQSRILSYGTTRSFAPFYKDDNGNVLSILDGNAVLAGAVNNSQEWATFIAMHPDIHSISAEKNTICALSQYLQKPYTAKPVMQYVGDANCLDPIICESLMPREIYPLLSTVFTTDLPPFEGWYVDVSHRIRHSLCHTAGIKKDGTAISTAMTVAESENTAIIGAIATDPLYRKQGLATKCIVSLIQELTNTHNKNTILICPKNQSAQRLYKKLHFKVCGQIGEIKLKD
jgi:GNAT superfamily N-acetyltransferase